MAVVVKYVVVRNGKEVMTFADKKEADAHDKQLDIAEGLYELLATAKLEIPDVQLDELAFFMAKHREQVIGLLRGVKPSIRPAKTAGSAPAETSAAGPSAVKPKPPNDNSTSGAGARRGARRAALAAAKPLARE